MGFTRRVFDQPHADVDQYSTRFARCLRVGGVSFCIGMESVGARGAAIAVNEQTVLFSRLVKKDVTQTASPEGNTHAEMKVHSAAGINGLHSVAIAASRRSCPAKCMPIIRKSGATVLGYRIGVWIKQ